MPLENIAHAHWTEIRLNQPPRNVLDRDMLEALVESLDQLAAAHQPNKHHSALQFDWLMRCGHGRNAIDLAPLDRLSAA